MPLIDVPQGSQKWLDARRGLITASVAPACLGIHPWMSRQKAYRTILGIEANKDNKHLAWGREFEDKARSAYECESGNIVLKTGLWTHPTIEWLGASPDGLVSGDGIVEIKCPSHIPSEVPPYYDVQMRVQLACTDSEWCDFFAWSQEGHFLKRIERDHKIEAEIIAKLGTFYSEFVLTNTEPPRKKRGVA